MSHFSFGKYFLLSTVSFVSFGTAIGQTATDVNAESVSSTIETTILPSDDASGVNDSLNENLPTEIVSNSTDSDLSLQDSGVEPPLVSEAEPVVEVEAQVIDQGPELGEDLYEIQDFTPLASGAQSAAIASDIELIIGSSLPDVTSSELEALREIYAARGYQPYFVVDETANEALDRAISLAPSHGLPATRYEFSAANGDLAMAEMQAATRFLRYSRDMERGIVSPRAMGSEFDFDPDGRSYSALFGAFSNATDKGAFFADLEPKDPAYPALKKELARMQAFLSNVNEEAILVPAGETLRAGSNSERVELLRARLAQLGFDADGSRVTGDSVVATEENTANLIADEIVNEELDAEIIDIDTPTEDENEEKFTALDLAANGAVSEGQTSPNLFDAGLEQAVIEFQSSAGLTADGIVGPATLAYLNTGPQDHMRSVLIGMERHRWGPQDRSGRQIYVNIANFMAEVRDDNQKTFETVVVVGKNKKDFRTPEFVDEMTHLIVNPKWNVPQSISVKEYLPKIQRDPGYLARNNITMRIKGSGQVVNPSRIDMSQFTVNDFPFLLQQQEGDGNALGNVKFMFPNKHNIYLHDTPSKSLFGRSIRTFSHGCVRVRDPEDFATVLLTPLTSDPRGAYQSYRASGKERRVDLATPIPIFLTYFTAYLNDSGTISYAPDSYGRDAQLAKLLEAEGLAI